jgi:hypothetical protein
MADILLKNKNNAEKLSDIIDKILQQSHHKPKYLEIFSNWSAVVGTCIASISAPYKIVTAAGKKILIIKCKKGCSVELQHESCKIINKIELFFGNRVFDQIRVIQIDINESLSNSE